MAAFDLGLIYEKLHLGDYLSDGELNYAIEKFAVLADGLGELGPTFRLAAKELRLDLESMQSFRAARDRK